jgi:hypothetical protein
MRHGVIIFMTIELFQVETKAAFLSRYRWEVGTVFPTLT